MYTICFTCFIVLLVPKFADTKYRSLRVGVFTFAGLMSIFPCAHAAFFLEEDFLPYFSVLEWAIGGAIYIAGGLIYAQRFPEKFYPGKFDIFVSYQMILNDIRELHIRFFMYSYYLLHSFTMKQLWGASITGRCFNALIEYRTRISDHKN